MLQPLWMEAVKAPHYDLLYILDEWGNGNCFPLTLEQRVLGVWQLNFIILILVLASANDGW